MVSCNLLTVNRNNSTVLPGYQDEFIPTLHKEQIYFKVISVISISEYQQTFLQNGGGESSSVNKI